MQQVSFPSCWLAHLLSAWWFYLHYLSIYFQYAKLKIITFIFAFFKISIYSRYVSPQITPCIKCNFVVLSGKGKKKTHNKILLFEIFCCTDTTFCRESIQKMLCPFPLFCFSCIVMLLKLPDVGAVSFGVRHCMDSFNRYPVQKGWQLQQ